MNNRLPLDGIRVLDIGTLIAGPFGATMLGDFGAEVIKVEQPGRGDALRGTTQPDGSASRSTNWLVEARNKKSVTLNLRVEAGQNILKEMIKHADVLFENFTPGTLERWGLGWDEVKKINPKIIMVRVSGYGQVGPTANARAMIGSHSGSQAICTRQASRTAFRSDPLSRQQITTPARSRRSRRCSHYINATCRAGKVR